VSFTAITLYVASQQVFIVVSVYFVTYSVRKLLDTPPYVVSGNELDDRCSIPSRYKDLFLRHHCIRTALRPPSLLLQGVTGAFCLEIRRPGHEADHSPSSFAEVKNAWSYTSTPHHTSIHRCYFTFSKQS
jgi:hypothetical protein